MIVEIHIMGRYLKSSCKDWHVFFFFFISFKIKSMQLWFVHDFFFLVSFRMPQFYHVRNTHLQHTFGIFIARIDGAIVSLLYAFLPSLDLNGYMFLYIWSAVVTDKMRHLKINRFQLYMRKWFYLDVILIEKLEQCCVLPSDTWSRR